MMATKQLKVGLFNAGSLGTKHDEFIVAMERVNAHIMAINETWIKDGQEEHAPSISGYRFRHISRPMSVKKGHGGGIGFYIKCGVNVRVCPHPPTPMVEQMWLKIKVNSQNVIIGTAYRPPWLNVNVFLDGLTQTIASFAECDHLVILGDFNINLLDHSDSKSKLLLSFFDYFNLNQLITEPTHFTDHSQTLIDLVCTDAKPRSVQVLHIADLGQHAMISVEFNMKSEKPTPQYIVYRPLKSIVTELFYENLNQLNWNYLENLTNINEVILIFNMYILNLYNIHAPKKKIYIKKRRLPWLTETILEMMHTRDTCHNQYKVSQSDIHKKCYSDMKHIVINAMYQEKKVYFQNNINRNIKNPKKLWNNLKSTILTSDKNSFDLPNHCRNPDLINAHFLDVPGNKHVHLSDLTFYEYHRGTSSVFKLETVSEHVVSSVILGLSSNAEGVDEITLDMIKLTLPHTLSIITKIVNLSISSSTFPDLWKISLIKPIPKKQNVNSVNDLRPISILPCLSKVLEKIVCNQIINYLENENILPPTQSGFRKKRSTATALLDVVDNMLLAQDQGMGTILVLLDFSRAFDAINIPLLLSKLSFYGFDMDTVKWFDSYLNLRSQIVNVTGLDGNTISSSRIYNLRGVPQGSVLGPILFILYSADIINCIQHCNYHIYADDLQVYISFPPQDSDVAVEKINNDLDRLADWSTANCMVLNPSKSKYLVIGSKKQVADITNQNPKIVIKSKQIEYVTEARNLGLVMDSHLKFEKHIQEAVRNCFYRLRVLYKIRPYLSTDIRIMLCESLILSKLNYADTVYGPCLLARTEQLLQRVQNACARFCFNIPARNHVTPFINDANLMKMNARRQLHLATLLFGIIKEKKPEYLWQKLTWENAYCARRPSRRLLIQHHKSQAFRGSFRFAASRCWNDIPPPLQALKTVKTFNRHLKVHLLRTQQTANVYH